MAEVKWDDADVELLNGLRPGSLRLQRKIRERRARREAKEQRWDNYAREMLADAQRGRERTDAWIAEMQASMAETRRILAEIEAALVVGQGMLPGVAHRKLTPIRHPATGQITAIMDEPVYGVVH